MLSYCLVIQRTVPVWHHKAGTVRLFRFLSSRPIQIPGIIIRPVFRNIPHLQKHHQKSGGRIPLQHNGGILPVPKTHLAVNVLVCQIHSAGKGSVAINDCDLTVVTVILIGRKDRTHRRKHLAVDSIFFQLLWVSVRHQGKTAHAIVHKTHFHTGGRLLFQDFQNTVPHLAFFHDKIFHENITLCFPQFLQKHRIHVISQRKILCAGIFPDWITSIPIHIIGQPRCSPALTVQPFHNLRPLSQHRFRFFYDFFQPPVNGPGSRLCLHKQIKQCAEHRKHQHRNDPGELIRRILVFINNVDHNNRTQSNKTAIQVKYMFPQPLKAQAEDHKLDQKCRDHKCGSPEYYPQKTSPGLLFRLIQFPFFLNIHSSSLLSTALLPVSFIVSFLPFQDGSCRVPPAVL